MSLAQLRRARLHAQLLADRRGGSVEDAVRTVVGIQAQALRPSQLAVRARTDGLTVTDVVAATTGSTTSSTSSSSASEPVSVVRSWVMRGTLHMVAAEDLGWLVALLGPTTIAADARRRAELGLTDALCRRAVEVLPEVLTEPLSRAELVDRLVGAGVAVTRTGQAPPHLLMYAACSGVICRGPDLERDEPTYVLVERLLGADGGAAASDRRTAAAELAVRYLRGYGPASVQDFATWSGLRVPEARTAFTDLVDGSTGDAGSARAERVDSEVGELLALAGTLDGLDGMEDPDALEGPGGLDEPGTARLLGAFDTLLLGYRSRDLILAPERATRVRAGGMIFPTVLVDGMVAGTWQTKRGRAGTAVTVRLFERVTRRTGAALEAEADDLGRFLGEPTTLVVER